MKTISGRDFDVPWWPFPRQVKPSWPRYILSETLLHAVPVAVGLVLGFIAGVAVRVLWKDARS